MFVRGFKTWCENTAVAFRKDLDLNPTDPLDPRALAKRLGIGVWQVDEIPDVPEDCLRVLLREDPDSWSAITIAVNEKRVIVLNSSHQGARPASNLAHELAHIILGHEPARVDVSEDNLLILHSFSRVQEEEANWLAGCLLLPREALIQIRRETWTDAEATRKYGISSDMLRYRRKVTGVDIQMARRKKISGGKR